MRIVRLGFQGLALGVALRFIAPLPLVAAPIIIKSLAQLEQSPPASADAFDFVVTGDTHSNKQLVFETDIIKGMIREWNILKLALVLEVGGFGSWWVGGKRTASMGSLSKTIAECRALFAAPGNHDISDAASERLWLERMVACDEVAAPFGEQVDREVKIHIANPFMATFKSSVSYWSNN